MTDNAPPSSFHAVVDVNRPSSTGPSGRPTSVKDKRRSLQIVSPGPRPFQLSSAALHSSSPSSACSSPIPGSARVHTPLSGTDSGKESRRNGHSPNPINFDAKSRRQSSISYFSSNRPTELERDTLRTPLSARAGLSRSNSLGVGTGRTPKSPSLGQTGRAISDSIGVDGDARERPPLTLAEKFVVSFILIFLLFLPFGLQACGSIAFHRAEGSQMPRAKVSISYPRSRTTSA